MAILLDDRPEEVQKELWPGLCSFAERLATLVPDLPPTSPVLLSGKWGSGKTTLLKAVEQGLSRNPAGPYPCVWFDAWRYERESSLLAALMRAVWDALPLQTRDRERIKAQVFDPLWRCALSLGRRVVPLAASALGLGPLAGVLEAITSGSLEEDIEAQRPTRRLEPPEDQTKELVQRFKELLQEGWGEAPQLVVLIDDLDRCSPEGALELLDGIRMLLLAAEDTGCRFVLALDRTVLRQTVATRFEGISAFDGNRYLEKLFPLSFEVPVPGSHDVGALLRSFLDRLGGDGANALDNDQVDSLSEALSEPLFANPRLMKRCINRFRLVVHFEADGSAATSEPSTVARNARALAKWIAATERWPDLRQAVLRRDEASWRLIHRSLTEAGASPPDPEAERLLAQEGIRPWLLREILGANLRVAPYRDADARLRRWGL